MVERDNTNLRRGSPCAFGKFATRYTTGLSRRLPNQTRSVRHTVRFGWLTDGGPGF
ncbi:hypothetical protein PGT21_008452 [Puccinia graminis f. sp. tritici]|uniref:Uncharacterized protein n=1 Tax=Puccinia graminis f. sp. tritici TaxID=56615 RepID=A0A5B0R1C5_PUCGR|nr:hypothetical protein PGT21_008452 [Puccinia graminis f. sp. tritici]